ncbi:colicin V family bacteriocin [Xenorhabdus thuongxuanensis]|uniref:Microcin n=1 Tax=Xenorhabdus thuongxuanensis TaxID=1873484 RepID=A0A1Q5TU52_9GAMM|nr:colicin V family bacteriocin [Xenorhabdus thuongxuanensis]OKP03755.1 Microcin [Xenorhabdus thuongxuanensis]
MKTLSQNELNFISGAGDSVDQANDKLISDLGKNIAWGTGLGAITGGPVGAAVGAVGAAVQTVVQEAINHGPVNVPIPSIPMNPSWTMDSNGLFNGMTFCQMKDMPEDCM